MFLREGAKGDSGLFPYHASPDLAASENNDLRTFLNRILLLPIWQLTAGMSSASNPLAPFIGSKQHYDASLNSAGTTVRKRKFDDSDPQSPPELGEPFTIEVDMNMIYAKSRR